ncbi:MAG: ACT domain-containing protein [Bacteroidales bacterium]|nr:ACT domain-containing protein [Bacteroidales bacterium]
MEKTIITVVGKDVTGIIAKSSTYLYEHNINILDIAQTIVQGIFNMMMVVDTSAMDLSFDELVIGLDELARKIGVDVRCQREEIFNMMHRI